MAKNPTAQDDKRIDELHAEATKLWPKLERLIDEMKKLGPHTLNGNNALDNTRNRLRDLSQR